MKLSPLRMINSISFIVCCALLIFAMYLQVAINLQPCPLCILQRIDIVLLGLVFLTGALYTPRTVGIRISAFLLLLLSGVGLAIAGKQIWLQHLPPDQLPPCMPDLNTMLQTLPFMDMLRLFVTGTADCSKVTWSFLDLSIPEWTAIFFGLFFLVGAWEMFQRKR